MEAPSGPGESQTARRRLVLAADDELRSIERELHGGLQQHLVALSVELQLVRALAETDPAAALERLGELERDLAAALDEAGRLARKIYRPPPAVGALAAELRAAAAAAGIPAKVDVDVDLDSSIPDAVARTVSLCWLDALESGESARPTISVRTDGRELVFEVVGAALSETRFERLRDRTEALGGSLGLGGEPGGTSCIHGTLPLEGAGD